MKRNAFALVETVLTVGVIAVTAGLSVPMYRNYQIRSDLDLAVTQTVQGLARAQLLSQTGENDGAWGYQVELGTVFQGDSYGVRDTDEDEVLPLPQSIIVSGITEVVFSRIDGVPSPTGDIILEALNGETRTITISTNGTLNASDIQEPDFGEDGGDDSGDSGGGDTGGDTGSDSDSGGDTGDVGTDGDTGGDTGSTGTDGGTTGGDTGSTGGSGGDSGGGSDDNDEETCEDRFAVQADGSIKTTGTVSVTFKALGSAITYGQGGPSIDVRAYASLDGGSNWTDLFDERPIDGGETETISSLISGQQIAVKVNGRYGWLFNKTYESNDQSGHIKVLRNGDTPPDIDAYGDQGSIESFLQDVLDEDGNISIGEYDVILLVELGSLATSSADFQDAVILMQFDQPEGSCAVSGEPQFKIDFDRIENTGQGNAAEKIFLGQAAWGYAPGQWIPLMYEGQIATDAGLTEGVAGMAVQRRNGYVRLLQHGSLSSGKEIVDARITFRNAEIAELENDAGQDKSENPFDGIITDGPGGDEATIENSTSALFQARVTTADDGILVYWQEADTDDDDSGATGGSDGGSTGGTGGDTGATTGGTDGGSDTGSDGGDSGDLPDVEDQCAASYVISNGRIVLQEEAHVTFRVLGSHATYGSNGPAIDMRLSASVDNGSNWRSLFGYRSVRGSEFETIENVPSGSAIVLRAEGRRAWLFRNQSDSNDASSRIKVLTRGDADPGTSPFLQPSKLKSFLRDKLTSRKADIRPRDVLMLVELQDLDSDADYQDAAVLVIVEKTFCGGGYGDDDGDDSGATGGSDGGTTGGSTGGTDGGSDGGSTGGDSGGDDDDDDEVKVTICHYSRNNRKANTIEVAQSAVSAHLAHGDYRGPCDGDDDDDGIVNKLDLCPATYMPEAVPSEFMIFKRYALQSTSEVFMEGPRKRVSNFTLSDTFGCSCEQLVDVAEGNKEYRFGLFPSLHREMRSLFPFYTLGARQYGCGKAMLKIVRKADLK